MSEQSGYNPRPANSSIMEAVNAGIAVLNMIPMSLILLAARVGIGMVFLLSAQTKAVDWNLFGALTFSLDLSPSLPYLFEEYGVPLLPPALAGWMATYLESWLPLFLFLGLFTRLAALGLFGMTAVIQIFVLPDTWSIHLLWASALMLIMSRGPGVFSVDYWLDRVMNRR
jgi:putative oxidoreductase